MRNTVKCTAGLYLACSILPGIAAANTTYQSDANVDEEIIVTATRSPYSIDKVPYRVRVITAEEIARSAVNTVEDLLRSQGSLLIRDSVGNGRDVRIAVRGMSGGSNAVVQVDGRRLNNSDLSQPDLTAIVLQDIDRIEILEGGAGVLFGDQAAGGVVNIITHDAAETGGEVAIELGSFDARNFRLGYSGRVGESFDYRFSAQRDDQEGYRDETEVDFLNLRGEAGYDYGDGRVFLELQRTDNGYLLPGALLDFERDSDRRQAGNSFNDYDIEADMYRLGVTHSFVRWGEFLASISRRDEDVTILGNSLFFGNSRTEQTREVTIFDPRLVMEFGELRLTLGADIESYSYDLSVNSVFGLSTSSHEHDRSSVYLQGIYSPIEPLQLSAGFRRAEVDVEVDGGFFSADYDVDATVAQLGVSWRLNDELRVYLNRDETFRFPLADENVDFLGNVVALDHQEGVAWELGGEWQRDGLEVGLVLFDHALENEIGYDTSIFANVNFADTGRRGATLDASVQLTDDLRLHGSLTRLAAEFEAGPRDGNRIPGVAEQLGKLALDYDFNSAFTLRAEVVHTGSIATDLNAIAAPADSYTVTNLALGYSVGNWSLRARLDNVFSEEYSELVTFFGIPAYYPSPEINGRVSLQYRF